MHWDFWMEKLVYEGPSTSILSATKEIDAKEYIALPGLVDPHTHTVFSGSRSSGLLEDWRVKKLQYHIGARWRNPLYSYAHTKKHCRGTAKHCHSKNASDATTWLSTTVGIKSGYGLTPESKKMLQALSEPLPKKFTNIFGSYHRQGVSE